MAKRKKNQRSDGRLQKCITFGGRRYYIYAKDKEELERKTYEKKQELEQGKEIHDNPTIQLFYQRWAENRRNSVKQATLRAQQCHFNTVSNIVIDGIAFKDYKLSEVKAEDIRVIQKTLLNGGNKARTVNEKIFFLSHMFHDAINEQYITFNPCAPVKPLKRTEVAARNTIHRALTPEETKLFFEQVQDSFYFDVYRFAIQTGMRIGEIGALKNSDIYDGAIHISRTITRTIDGGYCVGTETKTWHGKRTIPLNDAISEIIEHQRKLNRIMDGKISGIDDLIFKAPGRGLLMATPIDRQIKTVCKKIGIEKFTCHAFRDTFATRCIEQGIEPRTLQDLLGHSDFSLTMNLYGHVIDDTKQKAMNKLIIAI
jgi:integrase